MKDWDKVLSKVIFILGQHPRVMKNCSHSGLDPESRRRSGESREPFF